MTVHDTFRIKAEYRIDKLLTELNDSTSKTKSTSRGLWYCGALDKGNEITIIYREGDEDE